MKNQPFGDYQLSVHGIQGVDFHQSVALSMNTRNMSVFVQTDKAIYRPSDTVKFRVIVLNEKLKPLNETKIQIFITDGAQNPVKQFKDIVITKGAFQGSFELSDSPNLGNWSIVVVAHNKNEAIKVFEVSEESLPSFVVSLDVHPHANFDDQKITATVASKYTFGMMANGNATVTAEVEGKTVQKSLQVMIDQTSVEFDMKNDLNISRSAGDTTVKLFVTFKEELTGSVQNTTASVQIHPLPYRIIMKKKAEKFKPGLNFTVEAKVLYHNSQNEPIDDSSNPVVFTVAFREFRRCVNNKRYLYRKPIIENICTGGKSFEVEYKVDSIKGIYEKDIPIPENIDALNVTAKYGHAEIAEVNIPKAITDRNHFIHFIMITSKTET